MQQTGHLSRVHPAYCPMVVGIGSRPTTISTANGWMDEWMYRWMDGKMDRRIMDGWMHGWRTRWTDG